MITRLEYPNPTDPTPLYTKLLLEGVDDWDTFLIRASEVLTPSEAGLEGLSDEQTICMAIYRAYQCERDVLDSPKIPAVPGSPEPSISSFSAVGVAETTPPSDKRPSVTVLINPGDGEVLRKSSLGLSAPEIGAKVIQLIHQFPFLIPRRYIPLDSLNFDCMVGNHQFDDLPPLYRLSQGGAHELRAMINGRRSVKDEGYVAFCRENNIAINPYHLS